MIYPIKPCEIPRNFGAAAWWGPVCWSVASRERFPVESWFLPFLGGKKQLDNYGKWESHSKECRLFGMVFDCFCCQSMFRVPTGWLALGKVCESRDPKFTWEGVECIRYFQAGLPGKVAISVTNVADDLAGHVPAFWQCRFACGFEHHSFCFYTYPLVN